MAKAGIVAIMTLALLAGCKKSEPGGSAPMEAVETAAATPGDSAIKVSVPQIAYTYSYNFELAADRIADVQARHIALCDTLGQARCHVLGMRNGTHGGTATTSTLALKVDARAARAFSAELVKIVGASGGSESESSIESEDLSKQIVDTEAYLRSKQALAERLLVLLKTRNGSVADLVAAERSVAEVQGEIDTAQSWLAEARGRVSMSTFDLRYEPNGLIGRGFWASLSDSAGAMGGFFVRSLSLLIVVVAGLLPWGLLIGAVVLAWRYARRRFRKSGEG